MIGPHIVNKRCSDSDVGGKVIPQMRHTVAETLTFQITGTGLGQSYSVHSSS